MSFNIESIQFALDPAFFNGFVFGVGATGLVWLVRNLWRGRRER